MPFWGSDRLEPLSRLLFSLYKGQPNHGQWVVVCLEGSWVKILGERLAAVCRPSSFENSELKIEVLDPEWNKAIQSVKPEMLEKLRSATANEVKRISFSRRPLAGSQGERPLVCVTNNCRLNICRAAGHMVT